MNDEHMQPLLDKWYRDRDEAPRDANGGGARVMARVPEVRQRGRWWPLSVSQRKAQAPTATDTTDYRPSPIPATNGHAPTVIGRTQTMFSPVKAITAGALVFALGGVLLIAQPFGQQGGGVPGATTDTEVMGPMGANYFTATDTIVSGDTPGWAPGPGYTEAVDTTVVTDFAASDPRISGEATYTSNIRFYPFGEEGGIDPALWASSVRIVNADGAWAGTGTGYHDPEDAVREWYVLEGEGAYEGLSAVFRFVDGEVSEGVIVPGGQPPFPDPVVPPAE